MSSRTPTRSTLLRPSGTGQSETMRYGYYLANRRTMHGDPDLSCEATQTWSLWCGSFKRAGHYDGVSIYQRVDGTWARVLIVEDFFSETFKVHVRELQPVASQNA